MDPVDAARGSVGTTCASTSRSPNSSHLSPFDTISHVAWSTDCTESYPCQCVHMRRLLRAVRQEVVWLDLPSLERIGEGGEDRAGHRKKKSR